MKRNFAFTFIFSLILVFTSGCMPNLQTIGADEYYVQITDEGEPYKSNEYTRYAYELSGYDEDGEEKNLDFTADHDLKQDAFLLVYNKKKGVVTYEEVQLEDIPQAAQEKLVEE